MTMAASHPHPHLPSHSHSPASSSPPKPKPPPLRKHAPIYILGAGVFGLTSALHLSRRGYTNIHIFDSQAYHLTGYSPHPPQSHQQTGNKNGGGIGASCDENKILRASYGGQRLYQDLAFAAMGEWERWNEQVKKLSGEECEALGLDRGERLWNRCGFLRLSDVWEEDERRTQEGFPEDVKEKTQIRVGGDAADLAVRKGLAKRSKVDPFQRLGTKKATDGVLDLTAGFVRARQACAFVLRMLMREMEGVTVHLGAGIGEVIGFVRESDGTGKVVGVKTKDGTIWDGADLVIVAAGAWTPSLVPQADRLLEATAGSVVTLKLPEDRKDLWEKYDPANFPVWSWKMGGYQRGKTTGGLYGLPRMGDGTIKFGFRGAKWTNYTWETTEAGRKVSYPQTDLDEIPQKALQVVKDFCAENMPDLLQLEMLRGRLCWYTDSVDNSFLIDYVPDLPGLVVASGGSGHGFKFLPVLGEHVVDVVEGKDTEYTRLFRWRDVPEGTANGLEEGPSGWRTLDKQELVGRKDWNVS